jgi:hypothetical protein
MLRRNAVSFRVQYPHLAVFASSLLELFAQQHLVTHVRTPLVTLFEANHAHSWATKGQWVCAHGVSHPTLLADCYVVASREGNTCAPSIAHTSCQDHTAVRQHKNSYSDSSTTCRRRNDHASHASARSGDATAVSSRAAAIAGWGGLAVEGRTSNVSYLPVHFQRLCTAIIATSSAPDLHVLPMSCRHYGGAGDPWTIHYGSCGYYYLDPTRNKGWDVAALPDAVGDFSGSCG